MSDLSRPFPSNDDPIRPVQVLVSGRVQGVFFRACTREAALEAGVTGWVKNRPDGRVEAIFEGTPAAVEAMILWCHKGSPASDVTGVDVREVPFHGFEAFSITG